MDKSILDFYSDSHEEIRKVLGPPDNPDRPGFYLVTVECASLKIRLKDILKSLNLSTTYPLPLITPEKSLWKWASSMKMAD